MAGSGLDSLLNALKATGANVDDKFDNQKKENEAPKQEKQEPTKATEILTLKFVDKAKNLKTRGKIITGIIIVLILAAAYWWFHPPINIQSETTWMIVVILVLLPLFLFFRSRRQKFEDTKDSKEMLKEENKKQANKYKKLCFIPIGLACLGLLGMLISASFFPGNAEKYANVLQTQNLDFKTDIQEANYNQIPIIDRDTARVLGTKEMGTIPDYVSQFEISDLYSQINFQGKPVRVSCLMYADLFKWLTNREEGIPAYCIIDMTTQNAKIVRISDVDHTQGQGIKYSESEPLARNIERYIQLKYPFYIFDEFSFEVDEQGHPWWICPVQERTIGLFGGKTISRAVICDAVTGECEDMDVHDVPQWADRVYPSDLLLEQYNWSGKYKNGWLNSWIGQSGVVKTTPGTTASSNGSASSSKSLGYNYIAKDDDVWVYTGVTSATSDTSIVGFILINQRTAESHFYSIAGATEVSAMESAEGQVQHLRYVSTFPILINVANQPTYFMALKDSAGLVKKFAMIDIQRYQNVAIGDTVAECQKAYQALLTREGIEITGNTVSNGKEITGTISNMQQVVYDNNSHFLVTIAGDTHIYDFAIPGLIDIVKYKIGDQIHFHYTDGEKTQNATSID